MGQVRFERDGNVAILVLDNEPKLNALTPSMLDALEESCDRIEDEKGVRGVVLTGAGTRAFCAGADILYWGDMSPAEFGRHWIRRGYRAFDRLANLSKPTVAALQGHTLGGGLELAAACDLRVMGLKGWIALPETGLGVVPGWSGTQRLRRLLPEPMLKEMVLFSRRITAERAYNAGFVAELSDDPVAAACGLVRDLGSSSPSATEVAKYMIHAGANESSAEMIDALGGRLVAGTDDKSEGVSAFRAKRKPAFRGN